MMFTIQLEHTFNIELKSMKKSQIWWQILKSQAKNNVSVFICDFIFGLFPYILSIRP